MIPKLQWEYEEVKTVPEKDKELTRQIFADYGLCDASQNIVVEDLFRDCDKGVDCMKIFELGLK